MPPLSFKLGPYKKFPFVKITPIIFQFYGFAALENFRMRAFQKVGNTGYGMALKVCMAGQCQPRLTYSKFRTIGT